MAFLGPKIGPEPNFHLGPEPNIQKLPFYQILLFKVSLKPLYGFSDKRTWKKAKKANQKH